jgi:ABC-type transport system involved in multi-copper enzyme maturation permease subunit
MSRDGWRRVRTAVRASWDLVRLDLQVLTGNRLLLLALAEAAVFAAFVLVQLLGHDKADPVSFHVRTILLPGLLPAIALGMNAVMAERDVRHLEMTFASPAGRRLAWAVRTAGLLLACAVSSLALALATGAAIRGGPPPLQAALHATVALACVGTLATFLSVLLNGSAASGLVTTAAVLFSAFILHPASQADTGGALPARFDLFLNPFAPIPSVADPAAWFRVVVFNRGLLLTSAALCIAGTLGLLQRRERLLA